jgi:hypothetical protein
MWLRPLAWQASTPEQRLPEEPNWLEFERQTTIQSIPASLSCKWSNTVPPACTGDAAGKCLVPWSNVEIPDALPWTYGYDRPSMLAERPLMFSSWSPFPVVSFKPWWWQGVWLPRAGSATRNSSYGWSKRSSSSVRISIYVPPLLSLQALFRIASELKLRLVSRGGWVSPIACRSCETVVSV